MRPLPGHPVRPPATRPATGHAGLWFDKYCDRWRVQGGSWTMRSEKGDDEHNPKLDWINTLTTGKVGTARRIDEYVCRLMRLVDRRGGRAAVFTTESRFVTGLGRSHPVENGFAWHPTLGTPYLPGSSVKGLVRAWAKRDADPSPPRETTERLLGAYGTAGGISFLDAIPIAPAQLEADVMTPHYAGWTECDPPGDWRSPTPIPFLVTAAGTSFLFGAVPCRPVSDSDQNTVLCWLSSALAWLGSGAKTAVGYGRFERHDDKKAALMRRLREQDLKNEKRLRVEREARERESRLAALSATEREIEEVIDNRQDRTMPEIVAIMQAVESGRWAGAARLEAAEWLKSRMKKEKRWKEASRKRNPAKDRDYRNTLRIKAWLEGG